MKQSSSDILRVANLAVGRACDRTCPNCDAISLTLHLYKSSATGSVQEAHVFCTGCPFETYMRLSEVDNETNVDRVLFYSPAVGFADAADNQIRPARGSSRPPSRRS